VARRRKSCFFCGALFYNGTYQCDCDQHAPKVGPPHEKDSISDYAPPPNRHQDPPRRRSVQNATGASSSRITDRARVDATPSILLRPRSLSPRSSRPPQSQRVLHPPCSGLQRAGGSTRAASSVALSRTGSVLSDSASESIDITVQGGSSPLEGDRNSSSVPRRLVRIPNRVQLPSVEAHNARVNRARLPVFPENAPRVEATRLGYSQRSLHNRLQRYHQASISTTLERAARHLPFVDSDRLTEEMHAVLTLDANLQYLTQPRFANWIYALYYDAPCPVTPPPNVVMPVLPPVTSPVPIARAQSSPSVSQARPSWADRYPSWPFCNARHDLRVAHSCPSAHRRSCMPCRHAHKERRSGTSVPAVKKKRDDEGEGPSGSPRKAMPHSLQCTECHKRWSGANRAEIANDYNNHRCPSMAAVCLRCSYTFFNSSDVSAALEWRFHNCESACPRQRFPPRTPVKVLPKSVLRPQAKSFVMPVKRVVPAYQAHYKPAGVPWRKPKRGPFVRAPGDCYKKLFWLSRDLTGDEVSVSEVLAQTEEFAASLSGVLVDASLEADGDVHIKSVWWGKTFCNNVRELDEFPSPSDVSFGLRRSFLNIPKFLNFLRGIPAEQIVSHELERTYETSVVADPISVVAVAAPVIVRNAANAYAAAIPEGSIGVLSQIAADVAHSSQTALPPLPLDGMMPLPAPPPFSIPYPGFLDGLPSWLPHSPELARALDLLGRSLAPGVKLATALADVAVHVAQGAFFAHALLRVLFFLNQHYDDQHDNRTAYGSTQRASVPELPAVVQLQLIERAVLNQAVAPRNRVPIGPTSHELRLAKLLTVRETGVVNSAFAQIMTQRLGLLMAAPHDAPMLWLPTNVPEAVFAAFSDALPDFSVVRATYVHPHGAASSARYALFSRVLQKIQNSPVYLVGASAAQVSMTPHALHNAQPILSGRDAFRHEIAPTQAQRQFSEQIRCNNKFQDCPHRPPPNTVLFAPLSTHDIPFGEFCAHMAARGIAEAHVITHLPVPLLDSRISSYTDEVLGLLYKREVDGISVTHLGGASAGYRHSLALLTWLSPCVDLEGFHVLCEEVSKVGSMYHLHVSVVRGRQEIAPQAWYLADAPLVLPFLRPGWRRSGACKEFTVPGRRFRALVSFVAGLTPSQVSFSLVAAKLRGMLGEVRVGDQVIEERWDMGTEELYSTVGHALLAHLRHSGDYDLAMNAFIKREKAESRKHASFFDRLDQYVSDIFSWQINRRSDPLARTPLECVMDWFFFHSADSDSDYYQYTPREHWHFEQVHRVELPQVAIQRFVVGAAHIHAEMLSEAAVRIPPTLAAIGEYVDRQARDAVALPPRLLRRARRRQRMQDLEAAIAGLQAAAAGPAPVPPVVPPQLQRLVDHIDAVVAPAPALPLAVAEELPQVVAEDELQVVVPAEEAPLVGLAVANPEQLVQEVIDDAEVAEEENDANPEQLAQEVIADVNAVEEENDANPEQLAQDVAEGDDAVEPEALEPDDDDIAEHDDDELDDGLDDDVPEFVEPAPVAVAPMRHEVEYVAPRHPLVRDAAAQHVQIAIYPLEIARVTEVPLLLGGSPWPLPAAVTHGAARFYELFPTQEHFVAAEDFFEPAPDVGITQTIRLCLRRPLVISGFTRPAGNVVIPGGTPQELREHIMAFSRDRRTRGGVNFPDLVLSGIPSSAKTASAIQFFTESNLQRICVVCPSRALRDKWNRDGGRRFSVYTQHSLPPPNRRFGFLVMDECFSYDAATLLGWLSFARGGGMRVLLIGDPLQRVVENVDLLPLDHPLFTRRRLEMCVANSVPQDAFRLALTLVPENPMRAFYQTRSVRARSIVLLPLPINNLVSVEANLSVTGHPHMGQPHMPYSRTLSVGAAIGLREQSVWLTANLGNAQMHWFAVRPMALFVLLTRHTRVLFVSADFFSQQAVLPGVDFEMLPFVNGAPPLSKRYVPKFALDRLIHSAEVSRASIISRPAFPDVVTRGTNIMHAWNVPASLHSLHPAVFPAVTDEEIQGVIFSQTNFDLIKDHEHAVEFKIDAPMRLLKMTAPSALVTRKDVRSSFIDAHKMADIQVSGSSFESLRNFCLRNLTPAQKKFVSPVEVANAGIMIKRFVDCYVESPTFEMSEDSISSWLRRRTPTFLESIDERFGESRRTTTFVSFLKTQVKCKPVPGFAGTIQYGQQIVANDPSYSACFLDAQTKAFRRCSEILRSTCIIDCGYSDDELARAVRQWGVDFTQNTQIDVSRQDSQHTGAQVLAFAWFLKQLGIDEEIIELYVLMRSYYAVRSLQPGAFSGSIAWSLPSGDPFTLLANCYMMLVTVASRFTTASVAKSHVLQKGDDWLSNGHLVARDALTVLCAPTVLKIAVDTVPYHAGRLWLTDHFVADPVRSFCRHFARLRDESVSIDELHRSYVSRQVAMSEEDVRVVFYAVKMMYPFYSNEDIDVIFRTAAMLRDFEFFKRTATCGRDSPRIFDAPSDCALSVVRKLGIRVTQAEIRRLRGICQEEFVLFLREHNIRAMAVDHLAEVVAVRAVVLVSPSHTWVIFGLNGELPYELNESSSLQSWLLHSNNTSSDKRLVGNPIGTIGSLTTQWSPRSSGITTASSLATSNSADLSSAMGISRSSSEWSQKTQPPSRALSKPWGSITTSRSGATLNVLSDSLTSWTSPASSPTSTTTDGNPVLAKSSYTTTALALPTSSPISASTSSARTPGAEQAFHSLTKKVTRTSKQPRTSEFHSSVRLSRT